MSGLSSGLFNSPSPVRSFVDISGDVIFGPVSAIAVRVLVSADNFSPLFFNFSRNSADKVSLSGNVSVKIFGQKLGVSVHQSVHENFGVKVKVDISL